VIILFIGIRNRNSRETQITLSAYTSVGSPTVQVSKIECPFEIGNPRRMNYAPS
jgi:hypothetical protein